MKAVYLLLFTILIYIPSFGQDESQQSQRNRLQQIKIAKLTGDMNLSKGQAQKFWPIYNSFDSKRTEIRREIRHLSKSISEDDDLYKKQEKILGLKQKEIDLTRSYKNEFLKVVSEQQYGAMLASEERFNQQLLDRLKRSNP